MKDKICIYEKFGFCRNGSGCKFTHPTLVCDDQNCNIQECTKRHPQACRFFTHLKYCKFGDSCKFLHQMKPDDKISKEEYNTLKGKYDALEEKYSKIQDRVASLENKFFDLMRIEIQNIQKDANEKENENTDSNLVKRKASVSEDENIQLEDKRNKLSDVTIVSDDIMEEDMNDTQYHEILDLEYDVTKFLTCEIDDIRKNLKSSVIDVTIGKLNLIKDSIVFKRNELQQMRGQYRHPTEIDSENENAYKMMDDFIKMVEYLEKLPRKKFRNIADKDLIKMLDEIEEVHRQKENNLHLVFDGPKSFMEEDL